MAQCSKLQHNRLNISSDAPDKILMQVQARVAEQPKPDWDMVNGPSNFENLFEAPVTGYRHCRVLGPTPKTLDLVSHSAGEDSLLLLGEIDDDPARFKRLLIEATPGNDWVKSLKATKDTLKLLGIRRLRLLGCLTADKPKGRQTILALQQDLASEGIVVFGTTTYLAKKHFDARGFKAQHDEDGTLVSSDQISNGWMPRQEITPLPEDAAEVLGLDLDATPALTGEELGAYPGVKWPRSKLSEPAQDRDWELFYRSLHAAVGHGDARALPGLLARPDWEYWIPARTARGRYHLLHVLFGWRFLSVYAPALMVDRSSDDPFASAAVYRIENPDRFKRLLTTSPQDPIPFRRVAPPHPA